MSLQPGIKDKGLFADADLTYTRNGLSWMKVAVCRYAACCDDGIYGESVH